MAEFDPAGTTRDRDERAHTDTAAFDRAFDLLRRRRRREVLEKLRTDGEASVEELVDHLLAHDPEATDRNRVAVQLYHHTLPRLADAGIVDFDARTDTARYRGSELVDDLLTFVDDRRN